MPRKSKSAPRGAKAPPADNGDDSAEETTPPANAKSAKSPKTTKTPVADRVTRRSTRPSATKRPNYSDGSESEEEVMPRKRDRSGGRGQSASPSKATPAAKGGRGRGRPPAASKKASPKKKAARSPAKRRKNESDDESDSPDLGESEPEQEDDDDEEEEETVAAPRARGAPTRRGSGAKVSSAKSKPSPAATANRKSGGAKAGGQRGRGRPPARATPPAKSTKRGKAAADSEEDAEEESEAEDDYKPVTKAASKGRPRKPVAATPKAAASAKPRGRPPTARTASKVVASEDNASGDAASNEDSAGEEEEEEEDSKVGDAKEKVAAKNDAKPATDTEEAMDVDEPEKDKKDNTEAGDESNSETTKKHKLEDAGSNDEADLPPAKRARTEDDEKTTEDAKPAAVDKADGVASSKGEEKKEPEAAVNGSGDDSAKPEATEAKVNGDASAVNNEENGSGDTESVISASLGVALPRRCVLSGGGKVETSTGAFTVVSYNLASEDWSNKHSNLVSEVVALRPSILCLQEVDEDYFKSSLDSALKGHGYMGLYKPGRTATKGLATFYLLADFEIVHHKELEVHDLLEKDVLASELNESEKEAVKSFLHSPAPVLIAKLKSISNGKSITVGTIHLPSDDESLVAVQVSAVVRELLSVSEGASHPHVLCGSFNLGEGSPVQQLLKDGSLTSEVLDELKKMANVPVPEKENASLATLLAKSFQHPSACLKSSYGSVLGHEFKFPDKNQKVCRDSMWFSSDSLSTKSILDVGPPAESTAATPSGVHVSLKAELGFVN